MYRKASRDPRYSKSVWSENQKLQAVATYVLLGSMSQTAIATGIPLVTIKSWRNAQWFKDTLLQIRDEDLDKLDANLQRVIDKALLATEDRLDAGDWQYDPKTGKPIRIPVKAQIALRITNDLLNQQTKIREKPDKVEVEKTIDARLSKLSEEFIRFSKSKTIVGESRVIYGSPKSEGEKGLEAPVDTLT